LKSPSPWASVLIASFAPAGLEALLPSVLERAFRGEL